MTLPHAKILAVLTAFLLSPLSSVAWADEGMGLHGVELELNAPWQQPLELEERIYIIQLDEPPAVAFHRSQEAKAQIDTQRNTFDIRDAETKEYIDQLHKSQDELLAKLQLDEKPIYNYSYAFNGVAVKMTEVQAEKLRNTRGISGVWEDRLRYVATADSPEFLGLNDSEAGLAAAIGLSGENVIIGVIDSGIAVDHPSFSDTAGYDNINGGSVKSSSTKRKARGLCGQSFLQDTLLGDWLCGKIWRKYEEQTFNAPPPRWRGICQAGEGFDASQCNNKLIGARFYKAGFDASLQTDENEFFSPRDADGHGTHIASIAGGNQVQANIGGSDLGRVQGMAPRARIAVYKACWLQPGQTRASCSIADLQSAIEDAVADGVDLINFSVGDPDPSINDPDDRALLAAAEAGVLTVAAAGNEGPYPAGINSPGSAPWVLTVGASTREGLEFDSAISVDSPASLADDYIAVEATFTPPLSIYGAVSAPLILADDGEDQAPDGTAGNTYDACSPLINRAEMEGNVALIVRGGCDFDIKIQNAGNAGADAVLIYNDEDAPFQMAGDWQLADVPALMLGQADGVLLRDELVSGGEVNVTLDSSIFIQFAVDGNTMTSFSSRGPNPGLTTELADILKPDLTAPGQNILAGQTPDVANGVQGDLFQYLSGTSMSTPHVTGIAALLKQAYPEWGPDKIKSALMTTARQDVVKDDGLTAADPFDFGAGHVDPNKSINPGLTYPITSADYDAFLCGTSKPRLSLLACADLESRGYSSESYNLNLPSIALSRLVATTVVTRRVTNTGPAGNFSVSVEAPEGIEIDVSPELLSLQTGETATFSIQFTNEAVTNYEWLFGALSWTNGVTTVRSPIAVRPVILSAPVELVASGETGSINMPLQYGYNGSYNPGLHGLNKACVLPDANPDDDICENIASAFVADDPEDFYELTVDPAPYVTRFPLKIGANQLLLRVRQFNEFTSGDDDLDLYVYKCIDGVSCAVPELKASSGGDTSDEVIDIYDPAQGHWFIDVHGFATEAPSGTNFRLHAWTLGRDNDVGNLNLDNAPVGVSFGDAADIEVSWDSLDPGLYLGGISHANDPGIPPETRLTIIDVDARTAD